MKYLILMKVKMYHPFKITKMYQKNKKVIIMVVCYLFINDFLASNGTFLLQRLKEFLSNSVTLEKLSWLKIWMALSGSATTWRVWFRGEAISLYFGHVTLLFITSWVLLFWTLFFIKGGNVVLYLSSDNIWKRFCVSGYF